MYEPTDPKNPAGLVMLNRQLAKQDPSSRLTKALIQIRQAKFNVKWVKSQKRLYATMGMVLRCAYCGCLVDVTKYAKPSHGKIKVATVDHFVPIFMGGAKMNTDNFVIACEKCNGKKKADIWPISTLKYYYGPLNGTLTFVPEIKLEINFYIPYGISIFAPQLQTDVTV
jgi:hypothetical protein